MTFRLFYAFAAALMFAIEVFIAVFAHDNLVRPYVGDALAVVLVYCALRAVTRIGVKGGTAIALAIAFAVEGSQYLHFVDRIGLGEIRLARILLGTGFDPHDFIAYTAGAVFILIAEALRGRTP